MAEPESFTQFWQLYPRKIARLEARKVWRGIPERDVPEVLAGLKWYMAGEWRGREYQHIPHAATWLRGQRWNDAFVDEPVTQMTLTQVRERNAH